MLFINPIWDHESERIGKKKCTPVGYALHVVADLIGFVSLLLLPGAGVYLIYKILLGGFHASLLWLLIIPFMLAFLGSVLYRYSWVLACKKEFRYDANTREASWVENGQLHSYRH